MKIQKVTFLLLCMGLLAGGGSTAQADPLPRQGMVGGLLGFNTVNNNVGGGIAFGIQGAYYLNDSWGVGAFFRAGYHDNGISSTLFGAEGRYRLSGQLEGAEIGAILGSAKFSAGGFTGNTALAYGALVSYDHPFVKDQPVTGGAEISYLFTEPGTVNLCVLAVLATLKWWF